MAAPVRSMAMARLFFRSAGPKVVIAHTIKGKGVSFMEDRLEWHYKSPNDEQYTQAIRELDAATRSGSGSTGRCPETSW